MEFSSDLEAIRYQLMFNPLAMPCLVFICLYTLFFVYNVVLFFQHRKSFYIKNRHPWLIFESAFGAYMMSLILSIKIIITPDRFWNIIDLWYLWLFMPMHFIPYPIRATRFIFTYYCNKYTPLINPDHGLTIEEEQITKGVFFKFIRWLYFHDKYKSEWAFFIYSNILQGFAFIWGLYRQFAHWDVNGYHIRGSGLGPIAFLVMISLCILALIYMIVCIIVLAPINEALKINAELKAIGVLWVIFFLPSAGLGYVWTKTNGLLIFEASTLLFLVLSILSFLVSFGMPVHLACTSKTNVKFGIEKLDDLDFLINDPKASLLIEEHCVANMLECNYQFMKEVIEYQNTCDPERLKYKFLYIKKEYIDPESINHVNISDRITQQLMADNQASSQFFKPAYDDIHKVLMGNLAQSGFYESEKFMAYAREVAADNMQDLRRNSILLA